MFSPASPLDAEQVPLGAAAGRFARRGRDGAGRPAAVRELGDGRVRAAAEDTPGRLPVVFRIAAGLPADRPLEAGEAMAISTGGAVPDGADAVVQIELVVERDNDLEVRNRSSTGRTCGRRAATSAPARSSSRREPGSAPRRSAPSRRPAWPRWLSRGGRGSSSSAPARSCAPLGEPLGAGQIYESNAPMLAAALAAAGAVVERIGPVADDEAEHRRALERGLAADVLVSSGGVSVGPHDLVRRILAELGVEEDFWGVAVRPGKPLAFGVRGRTLVFGLPGNPVSALVGRRAVRPTGAARAPGRRRSGAELRVRQARVAAAPESRPRRARPRPDAPRRRRDAARAARAGRSRT